MDTYLLANNITVSVIAAGHVAIVNHCTVTSALAVHVRIPEIIRSYFTANYNIFG